MDEHAATAAGADDDESTGCYRHPQRLTAVRCSTCDRPICPDCAIQAAVGIKCRDCGRIPRSARAIIPPGRLLRGTAAAAILSVVAGLVFEQLNVTVLGWFIAWFAGGLIGTGAMRAAGGIRDPILARATATIAFIGFALPVLLAMLGGHAINARLLYHLIPAAFAAWGAWTRSA